MNRNSPWPCKFGTRQPENPAGKNRFSPDAAEGTHDAMSEPEIPSDVKPLLLASQPAASPLD